MEFAALVESPKAKGQALQHGSEVKIYATSPSLAHSHSIPRALGIVRLGLELELEPEVRSCLT